MSEILTESFCERCGTRYSFGAPPKPARLSRLRTLSRGFKSYVLSDETSLTDAMHEAQTDEDRSAATNQLDAFHETFNFCMSCRQYTCANCWNTAAGRCLSCEPLPEAVALPTPEIAQPPIAAESDFLHVLEARAATDPARAPDIWAILPPELIPPRPAVLPIAAASAAPPVEVPPSTETIEEAELRARLELIAPPGEPLRPSLPPELERRALAGGPAQWTRRLEPDDRAWYTAGTREPDEELTPHAARPAASAAPPADLEPVVRPALFEAAAASEDRERAAILEAETWASAAREPRVAPAPAPEALAAVPELDVSEVSEPPLTALELEPDVIAAFEAMVAAAERQQIAATQHESVVWAEPEPVFAPEPEPEGWDEPEPVIAAEPELVAAAAPDPEAWAEPEDEGVAATAAEPVAWPVHEPVAWPEPELEPIAATAAEPVAWPVHEPVAWPEPELEPIAATAAEPVASPLHEPIAWPEPEPIAASAPEPVTWPAREPIAWPELEPVAATAPTPEPAPAPVPLTPPVVWPPVDPAAVPEQVWWIVAPDPAAPRGVDVVSQPGWPAPQAPTTPSVLPPTRPPQAPPSRVVQPPASARLGAPEWPPAMPPPAKSPTASRPPMAAPAEAVWAASSRDVLNRPGSGVRGCVGCGLALSAAARFCRRCGSAQS